MTSSSDKVDEGCDGELRLDVYTHENSFMWCADTAIKGGKPGCGSSDSEYCLHSLIVHIIISLLVEW